LRVIFFPIPIPHRHSHSHRRLVQIPIYSRSFNMVSNLEKRMMVSHIQATSPIQKKECKLCHGPITSPTQSNSECHDSCASFACPGCISRDRKTYNILNLQNPSFEYNCTKCIIESDFDLYSPVTSRSHSQARSGDSSGTSSLSTSPTGSEFSS